MIYLDKPPQLVETRMFSSMPAEFRRPGVSSKWADANRGPIRVDCSIEGPSFDIRFGRIFRNSRDGIWSLIIKYDGWPNDLKIAPVGRCWWPTT